MPPPARITVPVKQPTQVANDMESSSSPSSSMARAKKSRVVARRRARGRLDETDSDEDIIREPRSDSDTDTAASSLGSESDSAEDEPKSRSRAPSPEDLLLVAEVDSSPMALPDVEESPFPKPQDWSDMVTDEKENGQAELPVIDFADFSVAENGTSQTEDAPSPSLPSLKQRKRSHSRDKAPEDASSSKPYAGFARQSYLQKLNSDPAYVPTVGQFWSHDDRLIDKNLRSLSGWWRGRWQGNGGGRGRGRGGFAGRGRGRSGFIEGESFQNDIDDGPWHHDRFGTDQDEKRARSSRGKGGGGQGGDVWKHDLFDPNAPEPDEPFRKARVPKNDRIHNSQYSSHDTAEEPMAAEKPTSPEPDIGGWGDSIQEDWARPPQDGEECVWGAADSAVSPKDEPSEPVWNNDPSEIQTTPKHAGKAEDDDGSAHIDNYGNSDGVDSNHDDAILPSQALTSINANDEEAPPINDTSYNDNFGTSSGGGWGDLASDQETQRKKQKEKKQEEKKKNKDQKGAHRMDTEAAAGLNTDNSGWAAPSDDGNGWANDANSWAIPSDEPIPWGVPTEEIGDADDSKLDDTGGSDELQGCRDDIVGWSAPQESTDDAGGRSAPQESTDDAGGWGAPQPDYGWSAPQADYGWGPTQNANMNDSGFNQGRSRRKGPRDNANSGQGSSTRGRGGKSRGGGRAKGQPSSGDALGSPKPAASPRPSRAKQAKIRPARMRAFAVPAEPDILAFGNNVRAWFAMKPERVWTKQFDGYLYAEADLKPVPAQGLGQGVRIKLPGTSSSVDNEDMVIRLPLDDAAIVWNEPVPIDPISSTSIVVKLPSARFLGEQREIPSTTSAIDETSSFGVAPLSAPQPTHSATLLMSPGWVDGTSVETPQTSQPSENWAEPAENVGEYYPADEQRVEPEQVDLTQSFHHSLQTFPPPFQPSVTYGSPYVYPVQGLPLPPGVAYAENGMTYEIATGRAVYLQTPPPPPIHPMPITMYNPQPMPHHGIVHYVPHASPMPMTMPPVGFAQNPALFSLPRQSTRVEIRAPGESKSSEKTKTDETPTQVSQEQSSRSKLTAHAEPFTPAAHMQAHTQAVEYYAESQPSFDDFQHQQQAMYQEPAYYYPMAADGNNPYGYAQHYPGVDVNNPTQYNPYGQEPYSGGYY